MSACSELIGRPYRHGADGTDPDGALDCIHLVLEVHRRLGLPTAPINPAWYNGSQVRIARDLLTWCRRVEAATYDGDVLLGMQSSIAFSVFWNQGCLYINQHLKAVAWCPITVIGKHRCFRLRSV